MCGFIFRKDDNFLGPQSLLNHRGPDEQSYFTGHGYEMEFSRLRVTGTGDGQVPVISSSKRWHVAFNGEIYNFQALISKFHLLQTDSDTKVIAEGLDKRGIEFLRNLRGMFAGVVIDTHEDRVFVFRDPLGEKPLFYSRSNTGLSISSEFTALLKMLQRPIQLDFFALSDFFRFGYAEEPSTFDTEIKAFKRGVVCEIDENSEFQEILVLPGYDLEETELSLPELLTLLSDEDTFTTVPTGLALSAGIDSTSLFYSMSRIQNRQFVPLIVNVSVSGLGTEALEAVAACKKLGVNPEIINYSMYSNLAEDLMRLSVLNDQPHADPSGLSYLRIFEAAKDIGLKVVMLGHGPDEIFWGYPWFNQELFESISSNIHINKDSRVFWNNPSSSARFNWYLKSIRSKERNLDASNFSSDTFLTSANPWQRYRAEIVHSYLSCNGLRQSDRLAMASSIEPRTPYADSRLYGWAQLNSVKNPTTFDKNEFRLAVDLGPLEQTRFRKKEGFLSSMGEWFRDSATNDLAGDCLNYLSKKDLDWRMKPRLKFLSPSEKYKIIMLGHWLSQFD